MNAPSFDKLRELLADMTLEERDFAAGDRVVNQVGHFATEARGLDTTSQPWLAEWLNAEHYKASALYTGAKVNWNHEQLGKNTADDRRMRATLVDRFNTWTGQVQGRLLTYEASPTAATVRPWLAELARFKSDPVRNL